MTTYDESGATYDGSTLTYDESGAAVSSGALPATVAVEVGFGSAPDVVSPTWTDVSAYVDLAAGVTITPGRTADRNSISPRTLSFTLDNRDDRFNPRNTGGPYYGDLTVRVPVRVRVTYYSTTYTLFRGFIDGGWPQDFTQLARTVTITAVDAVGWAANAPTPRSVYEVEMEQVIAEGMTPQGWLRPQSDSTWVDRITGHSFPHTAQLEKVDPLVDGDEEGCWADVEGDGSAVDLSDTIGAVEFSDASPGLIVFWVRGDQPGWANQPSVLCSWQGGVWADITIDWNIYANSYIFWAALGNIAEAFQRDDWLVRTGLGVNDTAPTILTGTTRMVAYWADGTSGRLWIDGVETEPLTTDVYGGAPAISTNHWTAVGRTMTNSYTATAPVDNGAARLAGGLDHVTWWTAVDTFSDTPEELIARLWEAGRLARVGDSMDQRMSWVLTAAGWDLVGTIESSSTVTQQGYRRAGNVLELLQVIEDTEQGRIWVDNSGQFRLSNRSWPHTNTKAASVQATFGDTGSDLPYSAALSRIVDDDRQIVNVAEVTRQYGTQQRSENAASIAAYGRRNPITLSNLLYPNDKQSRMVADWLVSVKGEPKARVEVLTFSALNEQATLVPLACQVEPLWMIRVNRDGFTFDTHVVDVGHRITLTGWDVSLNLDATRTGEVGFTWDDGTGTVGTPWDDGTGSTVGAAGWIF